MKNNTYILFAIVGIIVVLLIALSFTGGPAKLSGTEFIEKYANTQNAILIDVRTPAEFSAGHIEKAVNIDFENSSFVSEIKKLDTTKTYFVYCRSGSRSGRAISVMKSNGIKNIYELSGGLISNTSTVKLVTTATAAITLPGM